MGMEINFNGARKSLGIQFNKVSSLLKDQPLPEETIEAFNRLGQYIGTILATYSDGDPDFKDLSEEVTLKFLEEDEEEES